MNLILPGFHPGRGGGWTPPPPTQDLGGGGYILLIPPQVQVAMRNFKARTVTESVSLGEISLIVGMIKHYVIVTIVYLNAFYREKGQMIGYTLIIQ